MSESNSITIALLDLIPREFKDGSGHALITVWRNNTGTGTPRNAVQAAIALMLKGEIQQAIRTLQRPIKFGLVGSADILGIIAPHGRALAIEVKAGRDRQSFEQQAFQQMWTARGGIYIVARDVGACMEELRKALVPAREVEWI